MLYSIPGKISLDEDNLDHLCKAVECPKLVRVFMLLSFQFSILQNLLPHLENRTRTSVFSQYLYKHRYKNISDISLCTSSQKSVTKTNISKSFQGILGVLDLLVLNMIV